MSVGSFEKQTIEKAAILLGYPDAIAASDNTATILSRSYPDARDEALLSFLGHTASTTVDLTEKVNENNLDTITFVSPPNAVYIKEVFGVSSCGTTRLVSRFIEDADGIHISTRDNVFCMFKASIISNTEVLSRRGLKSYTAHLLAIDTASSLGRADYVSRLTARALSIKNSFSAAAMKSTGPVFATAVYGVTYTTGCGRNYGY